MATSPNSFAPPKSVVADVDVEQAGAEKASRGSRLGAALLDGLIFTAPFGPSYMAGLPALIHQSRTFGQTKPGAFAIWSALAGTGGWFYFAVLVGLCTVTLTAVLVYRNGQTIGKKLVGIKVVRTDESRAGFGRIFGLRYLLNTLITLVPVLGSIYGLADVLFIFGKEKRCLHDYLADTIVVRA